MESKPIVKKATNLEEKKNHQLFSSHPKDFEKQPLKAETFDSKLLAEKDRKLKMHYVQYFFKQARRIFAHSSIIYETSSQRVIESKVSLRKLPLKGLSNSF